MKKFVKAAGSIVSILSVLFVLSALVRTDAGAVQVKNPPAFLAVCMVGVAIKTASVFLSGNAWRLWLEFFSGRRCDRKAALRVYAKANIGKYMPGNVMHYVERNLFATGLGLSQKQIAAASMAEVASLVLAAFLLGAALSFSRLRAAVRTVFAEPAWLRGGLWICCGAALAAAALLYVCILRKKGRKRTGQAEKNAEKPRGRQAKNFAGICLRCFFINMSVLVLLGLILVILYRYWAGRLSFGLAVQMTAAYTIAWVLGFVVPGAPGGIGVRELVLTFLLAPVVGNDLTAAFSIVHRLITVIGDIAAYVLKDFL